MKNMESDLDILSQAIVDYLIKVAKDLFGFESLATQALIRYGVKNTISKYTGVLEFFTDSTNKLNVPLIINAVHDEIRARGGIQMMGIKFTSEDVDEILKNYHARSNTRTA